MPYDTFPDTPPVRCAGTTNFGAPCKNWAVLTKTLCRWHGGGSRRLMRPPCRVKACPIAGRFPRAQCGGRKERTGLSLIAGQGVLGQQHGSPVIRLHETQGSLLSRIPGMLLCCVKRRNDGCEALQDMEALAGDVAFEAADNLAL